MFVEDNFIKQDQAKEAPRPVSAMLLELVDGLPADHFTLEWLLGRLDRRSFGIVLLGLSLRHWCREFRYWPARCLRSGHLR
jgi:hypothetical protein